MTDITDISEDDLTNSDKPARLGLIILGLGLGGFLLWASLAPLDEGVPTLGSVSIETKRRVVQHPQGGLIQEVAVREGQTVKEGDLLIRLDDNAAKANLESARQSLAALRENSIAQQAVLRGLEEAEKNRADQLRLVEQELKGVRDLARDGFAPMSQQLQMERARADLLTAISDVRTNQQRTRQALLEIEHQTKASQQRLEAARQEFERLEIRAPAQGQVVGLAFHSAGSVIQPAQRILDVVPQGEALVIETRVPPQYIDRVKVGDAVDLRFSSFANSPQLVVKGQLASLSQDVLQDPNGIPYYLAHAAVTPDGLKALGARSLQPGMPVEVIIKTGSRTMLTYLLHPLTKRVAASLKEE